MEVEVPSVKVRVMSSTSNEGIGRGAIHANGPIRVVLVADETLLQASKAVLNC